jgi:hypothetical protein
MREFFERGEYDINVSTASHLKTEMKLFGAILECICSRNWMICRCDAGKTGFITSDHPVILRWSEPQKGMYGPGLGIRGTELIFPVSNSLLMYGSFECAEAVWDLDDSTIGMFNRIIASHADRQVFARDRDFQYLVAGELRAGDRLASEPFYSRVSEQTA